LDFYVSMGLWLSCLWFFSRLHVSSCGIHFCIKAMFQYPCFYIKCLFLYWVHFSSQINVLIHCFMSILRSIFLFLELYVYVCLCFINSIHSKDIYPKLTLSFCRFLRFMSSTFNTCHIFIGFIFSIFCILRLFFRFFCFLSYRLVGRHLRWNTFKQKC